MTLRSTIVSKDPIFGPQVLFQKRTTTTNGSVLRDLEGRSRLPTGERSVTLPEGLFSTLNGSSAPDQNLSTNLVPGYLRSQTVVGSGCPSSRSVLGWGVKKNVFKW